MNTASHERLVAFVNRPPFERGRDRLKAHALAGTLTAEVCRDEWGTGGADGWMCSPSGVRWDYDMDARAYATVATWDQVASVAREVYGQTPTLF